MNTGQYISGAAHIGLIGWLLIGDVFRSDPPAIDVTEVSVISAAEFDALYSPGIAPELATDIGSMALPPEEESTEDIPVPTEDHVLNLQEALDQPVELPPEETPDLTGLAPMPEAEVSLEVPTLALPSFEASPDIVIDDSPESSPRDVPRVAPIPVMRPELDVAVDTSVTESAAPDKEAEVVEEEAAEEEDAAPEEATTEIVTEAETPSGAPRSVPVPVMRPRPATEEATSQTLLSALSEAMGVEEAPETVTAPPIPTGPPLTFGEQENLRLAVSQCWNTGSLSSAALRVTVIVAVQMTEEGKPVSGSIRLMDSSDGDSDAVTQAYEAARRAILRCGLKGYDLPKEKYSQWRDIEMTFNPEKMRIK